MALDQMEQRPSGGKQYSREDAEIATRMGIQMLNEGGGLDLLRKAIEESQDPAQVIGQFLAQLMGSLAEQLAKEAGIDPGVFLAKNGFLESILNYIEKKLGYPEEFSDQIYGQVLETIKAAASQPAGQGMQAQQQAPQQQPMMGG